MPLPERTQPSFDRLESGTSVSTQNDNATLRPVNELLRQRAERFEFSILATEDDDDDDSQQGPHIVRRRRSLKPERQRNILRRMTSPRKEDPFFDLPENHKVVVEAEGIKKVRVPSLVECRSFLQNKELDKYKKRAINPVHMFMNLVLDIFAAIVIWFVNMFTAESLYVFCNAAGAAAYFGEARKDWALKLDFAFLSFAVVFPLTFLIQSTFTRREQALSSLADFKSSLLSAAMVSLIIDWPDKNGNPGNGRLQLPATFNAQVVKEFREFVKLVYEYLTMPRVSHARNRVFWSKQKITKRIHALQNGITQDINDYMFDFNVRTEEMKLHGFPSGEASRLHQYNQYIGQRWEHLRVFKYYRTPQSTRSFGRFYILVLPWFTGPYWAWLAVGTSITFSVFSCAFTFLVLLGLLNAQEGLEDPFVANYQSFMPGIDTIKLDFELATVIQAIEQYYANAELHRAWKLSQLNTSDKDELQPISEEQESVGLKKVAANTKSVEMEC